MSLPAAWWSSHQVGVHGEVDHTPAQGHVRRVAVLPVLAFACSTVWWVSGFFSSAVATGMPLTNRGTGRSSWLAASSTCPRRAGGPRPDDCPILDLELLGQRVGGPEVGEADVDTEVGDPIAEQIDHPVPARVVQLLGDPLRPGRLAPRSRHHGERPARPRPRIGSLWTNAIKLVGEDTGDRVQPVPVDAMPNQTLVVRRCSMWSSKLSSLVLKPGPRAPSPPRMACDLEVASSSWPVTAAVIRAWRYSARRLSWRLSARSSATQSVHAIQ